MVPDLFHIIPVGDDTVLNGVFQGQDTTLGLSFISDVRVLLAHTDHHTLVTGTTHNGWEDSSGRIITGETSYKKKGKQKKTKLGQRGRGKKSIDESTVSMGVMSPCLHHCHSMSTKSPKALGLHLCQKEKQRKMGREEKQRKVYL